MLFAPTVVTGPGAAPGQAGPTTTTTADGGLTPLLGLALWGTTLLFGATAVLWVVLTYVIGAGYEPPENEYVHVIAEEAIDVAGATVHVVPEDFSCRAVRKGRAQEWARQVLECQREFVLYLDEDSIVESFEGLPDADVVQLREKPRRTGSSLSFLADVYRMGVQLEQRAFARLSIPLFAWGGGIAVRADLEDRVTWDRETLVEDTAFVWAAFREYDIDFTLADSVCRNEAPPSLYEIFQQRRRWSAGNVQAAQLLPFRYQVLARVRNYAWTLSPIVTMVVVPLSLLVTVVHSMGTVAGILNPPENFRVTQKVGSE